MFAIVWYLSGCLSFVYWWTHDYDFTFSEVFICAFAGLFGVIAFPMGYVIHGKPNTKIIFKKRGEK